jgi:dipeptidyl aminopeptidase/acylaminoacyl peptidase
MQRIAVQTALLIGLIILLAACQPLNHFLIYPRQVPTPVITWSEEVSRGSLLLHLEWARPLGEGPFPAVLVHPEAGKTARDMLGIVWDLAQHGYVAAAVDYRRMIRGEYRQTMFAWREEGDVAVVFDVVRAQDRVDQERIGVLGFSQGGVFSLLIAAHAGAGIKTVVAYYPITDFVFWLDSANYTSAWQQLVVRQIRAYFRQQSEAATEAEFTAMLRRASPSAQAEAITAPVLLIHGESDTTAPIGESRRLYARLQMLGRKVELLAIPGAGHVFNFKNREQAAAAWEATLRWLAEGLRPGS